MIQRILVMQDMCLTQRFTDDAVLALAGRLRDGGREITVTAFAGFDAQALTEAKARKIQGCTVGYEADLPHWVETLRNDTKAQVAAFAERCRSMGVPCDTEVAEADPAGTLLALAEGCDWVAIPRDAKSSHWNELAGDHSASPEALCRVFLRHSTVPTFIGPLTPPPCPGTPADSILVAYDGSDGASRVVHSLGLLGLAASCQVALATVADADDRAQAMAEHACALLRRHGAEATHHSIQSGEHPAVVLMERLRATAPLCLAIGAFGHRSWREHIFGSVTEHLLTHCPCAILAQH